MSNIYQFEAELLEGDIKQFADYKGCLLYTSPSPRDWI
ncbi:hypothetical protein ACN6QQ_17685, partial [Acinetobacter baumannii]